MTRLSLATATILSLAMLSGCESTGKKTSSSNSKTVNVEASKTASRANQCPITRKELGAQAATRTFADHQVVFLTESEAYSFDELPGEKKRVVAGRQVLARQGVANERCLLTDEQLPIDAVVIVIENVRFGFVDQASRNEFDALPQEERLDLASPYVLYNIGVENTHCPLSGKPLHPNCPTIEVREAKIGFRNNDQVAAFHELPSDEQSEVVACFVLKREGVTNDVCPISNRPLRLDSPVVTVNGVLVGLRNVDAARAFNALSTEQKQKMLQASQL